MLTIYTASTHPINPSPSTQHTLTVPEIWKGLVLKCHKPQLFVAEMSDCEVLSETPTGLRRIVNFKEGKGPPTGFDQHSLKSFLSDSISAELKQAMVTQIVPTDLDEYVRDLQVSKQSDGSFGRVTVIRQQS